MMPGAGSYPIDVQRRIREFLKDLLNPEQFGYSVTEEVRTATRKLLKLIDEEKKNG